MQNNIEASFVREQAEGRWALIYSKLAPELSKAVGVWGRHVPCPHPSHANSRDAFRLFDKDGGARGGGICNTCKPRGGGEAFKDGVDILMWLKGWTFPETLMEVASALGIHDQTTGVRPRREPTEEEIAERQRQVDEMKKKDEDLRKHLNQLYIIQGRLLSEEDAAPARAYLRRRGLWDQQWANLKGLKYHPALSYLDSKGKYCGKWPALMAQIIGPDGKGITFHRIFLTPEGNKAPLDEVKKTMSVPTDRTLRGAAVRLAPPRRIIGVAEGLETAMAAMLATGMPVWSCLNATVLANFEPPEGVEEVVIWADLDKSGTGEEAARKLQAKLWGQSKKARVWMPAMGIPEDAKGVDWNDVWLAQGSAGFPASEIQNRSRACA